MIYSFRNIGKAQITGLQFEVKQTLNKHWKARLGYTYLRALNKSDKDMPRELLDKPRHKVDIGVDLRIRPVDGAVACGAIIIFICWIVTPCLAAVIIWYLILILIIPIVPLSDII